MKKNLKILVIRLSAIGDTIHTLPMVSALRQKFPDAQIDWVVEDKAMQFVVGNPLINKVYVLNKQAWKKNKFLSIDFSEFNKIIGDIRKEKYDIAIDVQQLFKSAIILKMSEAKRRITLSGGREFSYLFANEIIPAKAKLFDKNYHVVSRNMEIAEYLGCETEQIKFELPVVADDIKQSVDKLLKDTDKKKKNMIIAPATTWETKHWHNECWAKIIAEFQDKFNVIITATEKDKELVDDILLYGRNHNILNLTGKTSLKQLTELMARADVVIAPDSGSLQIAWAVGKPYVVSVFSCTSSNRTAPFGENTKSFSADLDCYPCHKKKCFSKNFEACKLSVASSDIIKFVKKLFNIE